MATEKATPATTIEVPPGFKLHTENTSHILLPDNNEAFLNPVQEFNRDLSVACIRTWAAEQGKMQESKWLQRQEQQKAGNGQYKKRRKGLHASEASVVVSLRPSVSDRGDETEAPPVENAPESSSQTSQPKQVS
jgi:tRNA (guanine26-N2/guanine27-N2)-dimethyltransferase